MLQPVVYKPGPSFEAASLPQAQLQELIVAVADRNMAGFLIERSLKEQINPDITSAVRDLGFEEFDRDTFRHYNDSQNIADFKDEPLDPDKMRWGDVGITSLHADTDQPQTIVISRGTAGQYALDIFDDGTDEPYYYMNRQSYLKPQTASLVLRSEVDTRQLNPVATSFIVRARDMVVFDPTKTHMGRTLSPLRVATSRFYKR